MIQGMTEGKQSLDAEPAAALATVRGRGIMGLILQFDGEDQQRQKQYKCNTSYEFARGERVLVRKVSGTYVVEAPIGSPNLYGTVVWQYNKQKNGTVSWGDDGYSVGYSAVNYSGVDVRTNSPVDLTNVDKILFRIRLKVFSDPNGLYLGAVKEKLDGSAPSPWDSNFAAYEKLTSRFNGIVYVDVSNLVGEYYICSHGFSQVYDVQSIQLL